MNEERTNTIKASIAFDITRDKVSKLKAGEQITFYRDGEISKKCYVQYNTDFSQRQFNADECRNV